MIIIVSWFVEIGPKRKAKITEYTFRINQYLANLWEWVLKMGIRYYVYFFTYMSRVTCVED